jgi:hypothetical protein
VAALAQALAVQLLALVFLLSGIAKLRRPMPTAVAMVRFGVVPRPRPAVGAALGLLELLVAAGLVWPHGEQPALGAAAVLLTAFAVLLARALAGSDRFPCACFGDGGEPISAWTLTRAALLALVASVALLAAGPGGAALPTRVLAACSAAALLGTAMLASKLPRLLRWNAEPGPTVRWRS